MLIEPELIERELLRTANWQAINQRTQNINENANVPLRMILEFANDCGIKPGDADSMLKGLSSHRSCSIGILVNDESVRFAKE